MYIVDSCENNKNRKYVLKLEDGCCIEAALFEHRGAIHFCIPTQVGCCIGCRHCSTTYAPIPYVRNLSLNELNDIVALMETQLWDKDSPQILSFSGHGEPMLNWDNIRKCEAENRSKFADIYMTSVGMVHTMKKILSESNFYPSIYFSIHASCDEEREQLIPLTSQNEIANLQQIIDFGRSYTRNGGRVVWNYMICNINSSDKSCCQFLNLCQKVDYALDIRFTKYIDIQKENKINEVSDTISYAFGKKISEQLASNIHVRFSSLEGKEMGIACGQMRASLQRRNDMEKQVIDK